MDALCTHADIKKMQNHKLEREVKNRTDLEKSIQERKVHTGLQ